MRSLSWVAVAIVMAACSGGSPTASGEQAASPSPIGAVIELLDCDGPPSSMGGIGPFGVVTLGDTPASALASWLEDPVFVVPVNNWALYGTAGDRTVFVYRTTDRIKVAAVFSTEHTEVGEGIFTLDELRACEESEFGPDAIFANDDRVWANDAGSILREQAGPAHCDWQDARFLFITEGAQGLLYVGDPLGVMPAGTLEEPYDGDAALPADATASGYRNGDLELWFVPDGRAVFVVGSDRVELWPRSDVGCM